MPKKKDPTFVSEPPMLFALNRAARRKAKAKGLNATYVPMPCLLVGEDGFYYMQHASGQLEAYTPYGPRRTE